MNLYALVISGFLSALSVGVLFVSLNGEIMRNKEELASQGKRIVEYKTLIDAQERLILALQGIHDETGTGTVHHIDSGK